MVSARSLFVAAAAAITLPLASAADCTFNASLPFTLHTEVTKGPEDYNNFFLTSFHVGAGEQTVVGTRNASKSIGWVLEDTFLQQPIGTLPNYNFSLLEQAPYLSNAPANYDYVSLSLSGSTAGFGFAASNKSTTSIVYNGTSDFTGFALCHVNGTAPYFTAGPQYQLLWKSPATTSSYESCADVDLIAHNIE